MTGWLDSCVVAAQADVTAELEQLVEQKGLKQKVLAQAQDYAKIAARHILDPTQPALPVFPGVSMEGEKELQYLIVLEFLQSAGFKFAPSVLKFESQHPEVVVDRRDLGKRLGLCTYDRTPFLVQLIERELRSHGA